MRISMQRSSVTLATGTSVGGTTGGMFEDAYVDDSSASTPDSKFNPGRVQHKFVSAKFGEKANIGEPVKPMVRDPYPARERVGKAPLDALEQEQPTAKKVNKKEKAEVKDSPRVTGSVRGRGPGGRTTMAYVKKTETKTTNFTSEVLDISGDGSNVDIIPSEKGAASPAPLFKRCRFSLKCRGRLFLACLSPLQLI